MGALRLAWMDRGGIGRPDGRRGAGERGATAGGSAPTACGGVRRAGFRLALCMVASCASLSAWADQLRVVSVAKADPAGVSVVVESPEAAPQKTQFSLRFDDGRTVAASAVEPAASQPLVVAVCVDRSGSMGSAVVQDVRESLKRFVERSSSKLDMSLIGFGSVTKTLASFGAPGQALSEGIGQLTPERSGDGKTKLFEALSGALDQLKARESSGPKRLLVISDGKDEGSSTSLDRIADKAKALKVPIDAIGVGPVAPRFSASLEDLANRTDGSFVLVKSGGGSVSDALDKLIGQPAVAARPLAVRFGYDAAADGRTAGRTVLLFTRSGGGAEPLQAEMPGAIPALAAAPLPEKDSVPAQATEPEKKATQETQVPASPRSTVYALLAATMVAAALVWLLLRRSKRAAPAAAGAAAGAGAGASAGPVASGPVAVEPVRRAHPPQRMTHVSSASFPAPQPGRPSAVLVSLGAAGGNQETPIEKEVFSIGAGRANDLRLEGDEYASSDHAYIRYDSGDLYLTDRQSRNGTFVNDARILATTALNPGDRIRVGHSVWRLEAAGTP